MGSIDRHIFRTTLASFALVLVSLTGAIWIAQALRGIDLLTIALMIAISHTLNKLATDSESIVMNGPGLGIIIRSVVIEPPAVLMDAIGRSSARLSRLFVWPATA
jgi:lipopolysaccharide export LptBFGC system permease protein LptF